MPDRASSRDASPGTWLLLLRARLSRRIVLWVFASIVVIEGIILIPSVYRRQQELLTHLKELSAARTEGALGVLEPSPSSETVLTQLQRATTNSVVLGGALYEVNGSLVGTFGETPELTFADVQRQPQVERYWQSIGRYDAAWSMPMLNDRFILLIRHDATAVQQELLAFIGRIIVLVLIISAFVTIATLVVLNPFLIMPIIRLRKDLLTAAIALRQDEAPPQFESLKFSRQDELGEVTAAFQQMYQQVSEAIAERKQAEAALRQSEEKFSKAFRASPNPILISTLSDGRLLEVNDSFLHLYGGTVEELVGHTATELRLWTTSEDRADMLERLRTDRIVRNQEYTFRTKSGEPRIILYSTELIWLNGEECLVSIANDITERKQAEEALRLSEERFRALVEQAADAIFVIDANGQYLDVNQQACRNLGYSREELLTRSVTDIQQRLPTRNFAELMQQLTPNTPITYEGLHQRKDGSIFPVEVRVGLFRSQGRNLALGIARDISERKQAQEAQARLAEIGELAAMIVHEVRNPLTTVLIGLESFKSLSLTDRARMRLDLALEEADRLQRLLNEILLYAKCQTLHLTELEVNDFITELLDLIQALPAAQRRLIQFNPSHKLLLLGDRDKLTQVFMNLVENACEAVSEGETITWSVERLNDRHLCISLHNGGAPIPPDLLPQLTQPFFTTKSTGNGLGLAIVKRIVEAHSGQLLIESSVEQGTWVRVVLPIAGLQNS